MNRTLTTLLAASTLLTGGVAATSAQASPALAGWVDGVEAQIDRTLDYPTMVGNAAPSGVVTVAFTRGDDGRASAVRVARSSGSAMLDGEAVRTVKRLRDLAPLPAGIADGTPVHVQLAFGSDDNAFRRALASMKIAQRDNNVRLAALKEMQVASR